VYLSNVPHDHVLRVKCTLCAIIWHVHMESFDMFTWSHLTCSHEMPNMSIVQVTSYVYAKYWHVSMCVYYICIMSCVHVRCTMYSRSCTNSCQVFLMCICICLIYCRSRSIKYFTWLVSYLILHYDIHVDIVLPVCYPQLFFPNWSSKVYSPEKIMIPNLA